MREIEVEVIRDRLNKIPINQFIVRKASVLTRIEPEVQLSRKKDICDFLALGIYCLSKAICTPDDREIVIRFSDDGFGTRNSNIKMMVSGGAEYPIAINALSVQCCSNCQRVIRYMTGKERENDPNLRIIGTILYPNFTAYAHGYFGEYPMYDEIVPKKFDCLDTVAAQKFAYELLSEECSRYLVV